MAFHLVNPEDIQVGDYVKITPVCPCLSHAKKKDGIKTGGVPSAYPERCPHCKKVPPKPIGGPIVEVTANSVVFKRGDGENYVFNRWSPKASYAREE